MRLALSLIMLMATGSVQIMPASASEAAWRALQEGGSVAVFRHARAPGTGDPANFRLEDCSTQRNLSDEGREQSRRIGEQFRLRRIPVERVLSSRWCRALDTARLAFGASAEPFQPLDSFFSGRETQEAQTQAVRSLIEGWRGSGVLVLITHQVNITALTGVFPAEGEALVLRPRADSGFEIVGRIKP